MEEDLSWLVPAKAEELTVVIIGDLRLLGVISVSMPQNGKTFLNNAFPIGSAVARSQEMGTINVPALGFLHWCVYEPVRYVDLTHASYSSYKVKYQSKRAQDRFETAYNTFVAKCIEMHKPQTGLIVTPDMGKVDAMAEKAGGPSNLVSILQGKEPER